MHIIWELQFKEDEKFLKEWIFKEGNYFPKVGIFIVTYNAINTLAKTLRRIPSIIYDIVEEIFVFDDASKDDTYLLAEGFKKVYGLQKMTVKKHTYNLGYGGNQKAGYQYAIKRGLDYVVLLHGDGQYAPEALPSLIRPVLEKKAKVVFGSRMLIPGEARKGGMPLYKFIGNKLLSKFQNLILDLNLSEYHSGYRLYSVDLLRKIPFMLNSNDFHFDTEIIVQIHELGEKIYEVPIPTFYGDEICYVNVLKYGWNVIRTMLDYQLYQWGLREDPRFKLNISSLSPSKYSLKYHPLSSHMQIAKMVPHESKVLDIGCGEGLLLPLLVGKGCKVVGIDILPPEKIKEGFVAYHNINLETEPHIPYPNETFDVVILADFIEHIRNPQVVLKEAKRVIKPAGKLIVSTGNIALWLYRFLLLFGSFPYAKKGILDETHVHLYTFSTFRNLIRSCGFKILKVNTTPIPFDLILKNKIGRNLVYLYYFLTKIWGKLFAYQFILLCEKINDELVQKM